MEAGVIRSLEVEDASPTSTALMTLQRWMERVAEKEVERITAKCRRYQEQGKSVPKWVRAGMDERFRRVEQVEQRVQMLLGIFEPGIEEEREFLDLPGMLFSFQGPGAGDEREVRSLDAIADQAAKVKILELVGKPPITGCLDPAAPQSLSLGTEVLDVRMFPFILSLAIAAFPVLHRP
jgi:hypothetical protein